MGGTYAVGSCIHSHVRTCQYSSQAKDCVCNSKYFLDTDPAPETVEIGTIPRRTGVHLPGGILAAPVVHDEPTFDFVVAPACENEDGVPEHVETRRLDEDL